ncbi:NUDIX hydrolase [Shimazuella sp. AN120528]|uniref:NUDIX hydrolase n=1 Tax=Shimazuella soli TaxID=1892854 RepID=UPI001F0FC17B|nr:NUDIX hydrolase [Shimazuella soli]MCH5585216.1 NUDIX hydrolase [Shimazuella soli]
MIMQEEIKQVIHLYSIQFPSDNIASLQPLCESMNTSITLRTNVSGHVTTSAVIIDPNNRVLHIKHKILKKWLLPGGHCEETDQSLIDASLREAVEETGIPLNCLHCIQEENVPIDIDLHEIPSNPQKDEPGHWHADFRFVFRLDSSQSIILQEEEVTDYAWLSLEEMPMRLLANKLNDFIIQKTNI